MDLDKLSKLIRDIYERPFAGNYSQEMLAALAEFLDSEIVAVMEQEPNSGHTRGLAIRGFTDAAMRSYEEYYAYRSVLLKESAKYKRVGHIFSDHMIPCYGDYTKSETYNDFFAPQEADHLMQAHIERAEGWVTALALRRSKARGIYSNGDHEKFTLLIPHLVSAARHSRLLVSQALVSQSLIGALENLQLAVLVLDSCHRIVFTNRQGEELLRERKLLAARNRRLVAVRHEDDRHLQRLLGRAREALEVGTQRPTNHLMIETPGEEPDLFVSAMPLTRRIAAPFGSQPAIVVFVSAARPLRGAEELIGSLYGLTRAEARVVVGLYDGLDVAQIAEAAGTSRDAVRFHLKNVFQKLGIHRQTELIKLVSAGPALLFTDRNELS